MGRCSICLSSAEVLPSTGDFTIVECGSCGKFKLSGSAEAAIQRYPDPLNRERLSEAVRDYCKRPTSELPSIDECSISKMIRISVL